MNTQKTKIEGLLIRKMPYGERDIIGELLLRNGKKVGIRFFGGRGGGKKRKSSILELGHLLSIELAKEKIRKREILYKSSEWSLTWAHKCVRHNYKAYTFLLFYCDLLRTVALEDDLFLEGSSSMVDREHEGIFRVASNSTFYLDQSLKEEKTSLEVQLLLFLCKLLFEMGLAPRFKECVYCGRSLTLSTVGKIIYDQGGMTCIECLESSFKREHIRSISQEIFRFIEKIWCLKYSDYEQLRVPSKKVLAELYQYFCFHSQMNFNKQKYYADLLFGGNLKH